ncbi:MAG: hypothetical protein LUC16_01580 [Coprobacillus sp.]|nr:hypothetical protein [Coprobacillus sp.]
MGNEQLRAAKIAEQQALLDGAKSQGRELTDEENAKFEALQREIETLTLEIEKDKEGSKAADPADATREAVNAERKRIQDITSLCKEFGVEEAKYIQDGSSLDQVRAAVLDQLRVNNAPVNVKVTRDETDTFKARAVDALMMRAGMPVEHPAEGANQLRGMSLRDLAIESLSREGESISELLRMSSDDLYGTLCRAFYNPTAAFPAILDQTIEKSIVQLYQMVPTTFEAFTTKGSLTDFKETRDHEYVIGGVGDFLLVPENGEIKADIPQTELLPTRKLETYGKQFSMTRQAFINDDIGFLTEVPGLYATKAKQTIDKQVYQILFDNKTIFDGTPLFSDDHNNLLSKGSAPTQGVIQSMIMKMQLQKDQFGDAIYVIPEFIVVPIGYAFDLYAIFHSTQITGSDWNDANPLYNYQNQIKIIESPVLNAMAGEDACPWFMVANAQSCRGIQVDYLNGQETPTVRRMEVPGTLGFVWDIYLDWGIAVRDFRGIVENPGVALDIE